MKAQSTPTVSRRWKAASHSLLVLAVLFGGSICIAKDLGIVDVLNWSSGAINAGMLCLSAACSGMAYRTHPTNPTEGTRS